MRSFGRRFLEKLLPDTDWAREFVESLEAEADRIAEHRPGGRLRATLWYLLQLLRPATLAFVLRLRRRARPRSRRPGSSLLDLGLDLRHASRSLRRDPRVAGFVGLTLAVGIGGVTALYGVADRLFLSGPLHVADADEVVRVYLEVEDPSGSRVSPWIPWATAEAIRRRTGTFEALTLHRHQETLARTGGVTRPAAVAFTDLHYFELLGPTMVRGRSFGPGDAEMPAVAVVSEAFARERFGEPAPGEAGSGALGRTVDLDDRAVTIIGVAPRGFAGGGLDRIDLWTPLDPEALGSRNWWVTARLADDRTARAAAAEAQSIHLDTDPGRFFQWAREGEIRVAGLDRDLEGNRTIERSIVLLLLAVVGLVLVVAWVNALNLLFARLTRRRGELDVRIALGIGRLRMARQLLLESGLLALLGVMLALPLGWLAGDLIRSLLLPEVAWADGGLAATDLRVTGALGALSALLLGALTFLRTGVDPRHGSPGRSLHSRRATGSRESLRLQRALATAQVALSSALLLCAVLFLRSFWTMKSTDLGLDADRVYALELRSLDESWSSREADAVHRAALDRVRQADPGTRWALTVGLPFRSNFGLSIHLPGRDSVPVLPGGGPFVTLVSEGYFETVGTRILRGRGLVGRSPSRPPREVVVGASTAAALWPEGGELGSCVRIGGPDDPCWTVVGVAEDVHRQGYREPPSLQLYGPIGATDVIRDATLLARPRAGSAPSPAARRALIGVDPRVDFVEARRIDSLLSAEIRPWRLGATMLSLAAGLAVAIALAGVLAVLSYLVAQRRGEFGVRLALGASPETVGRMILGLGVRTGVVGAALGIGAVLVAERWIAPLLFETRVLSPLVMGAVALLVVSTATLACLLPAHTATRIDPIEALRTQL